MPWGYPGGTLGVHLAPGVAPAHEDIKYGLDQNHLYFFFICSKNIRDADSQRYEDLLRSATAYSWGRTDIPDSLVLLHSACAGPSHEFQGESADRFPAGRAASLDSARWHSDRVAALSDSPTAR